MILNRLKKNTLIFLKNEIIGRYYFISASGIQLLGRQTGDEHWTSKVCTVSLCYEISLNNKISQNI